MTQVTENNGVKILDVAGLCLSGAQAAVKIAAQAAEKAISAHGGDTEISFPETAFYLPLIYAVLGKEVRTLSDAKAVIEGVRPLAKKRPVGEWGTFLQDALDGGLAAAVAAEVIEAVKLLSAGDTAGGWSGFIPDAVLRSLGIQLVDGRICGVAVIVGAAPDPRRAVSIARDLQSKGILSLLVGSANGTTFKAQLDQEKVATGLESYIVPVGPDTTSVIHAANFAIRAALTFGGLKKGQAKECVEYCKKRVPAFILALGPLDELKVAAAFAALNLGFPVITDQDVPFVGKIPQTLHEALISEKDYNKIATRCVDARGIKVRVEKVDIPVSYAAAFEGERVRKEDMSVQFGSKFSTAFEYLRMKGLSEVEDGRITVTGPEIDSVPEGGALPLGVLVEVAGRKMQADFEPILERQIHKLFNHAMGVFHVGQRDMCLVRVSRKAKDAGFKLRHFGSIIWARLHAEYGSIVDKIQVKILTNEKDVLAVLREARAVYVKRDERLAGMTDESVDDFYSCELCQSFAPNHVCVISPERLGLCGAFSWLDAKAAHEIIPTGGNKPIAKGAVEDADKGIWKGVNEFVYKYSHEAVPRVSLYSIMDSPMSSCGCFECIVAVVPEANGVMVVNREYTGATPCGMKFSTLAGTVGGGTQTPGFMGVGRLYMASDKFIRADGGIRRIVWMTKELKDYLKEKLVKRCEKEGVPGLFDKIADETVTTDPAELVAYLEKIGHPALSMEPLI